MTESLSPAGIVTLVCAAAAAVLIITHLLRPQLTRTSRMRLLFGLGVFPIAAAVASSANGLNRTTERSFCGSCHVMENHVADASDPESTSLAARHGRNAFTGGHNCYVCHADYGMYGYPLTKLTGMKHVYYYYLGGYRKMPMAQAMTDIRVVKPFPNSNCMQCHSGTLESFKGGREHRALLGDLTSNKVACASAGCHGYSHPFNKDPPKPTAAEATP